MLQIPDDRCERHRLFKAIDDAFKAGDIEALKLALGNSSHWFDDPMPCELGLDHPLGDDTAVSCNPDRGAQ
jgi:hypothetical protein